MAEPTTLYKDFKLTLDNCHEEPINRPVAIQGHGHMLVFTGAERDWRLHAVSGQFAEVLGLAADALWGCSLLETLPETFAEMLIARSVGGTTAAEHSGHWEAPTGQCFNVISHCNADCTVLEFEPAVEAVVDPKVLPRLAKRLLLAQTTTELYAMATSAIAELYDFDRVMIYQFDEDKHGHVIGEAKREHLQPFLGLHYPETDIPKMARDVFLKVGSRSISDIHVNNDALEFSQEPLPSSPYLDLTHSQLRAISPIHIEYLANMGVQSTLTLSIVINGDLWGLIACHHYAPRQIRFESRSQGEVIGALLAKRISELDIRDQAIAERNGRAIEADFLDRVKLGQDYRIELLQHAPSTLNMCDADGVALVTLDEAPFSSGLVPKKEDLLAIRDWLVENEHDAVFETAEFAKTTGINTKPEAAIGGMLASCLSNISNSYLLWFRQPVSKSTLWAGDPEKNFSAETSPDTGEIRLSPRQSFAKWQVVVEGQSHHWEKSALRMALRIREGIVSKELIYTADLIKRSNEEFMQLTYAAVHDLQEPLRTQTNYLELMEETLGSSPIDQQREHLLATKLAADRMRDLIKDLLSFASISAENSRQEFSLDEMAADLIEDLAAVIAESGAEVNVASLPAIVGDKHKFRQLLLNLLSNAIKYVAKDQQPVVKVYIEVDGAFWMLCVEDNGIGIEEKYFDNIFKLFKRLHRKTEYAGTGIGLATCKKIAESLSAVISVESQVDQGSIFRVKFHESILQGQYD